MGDGGGTSGGGGTRGTRREVPFDPGLGKEDGTSSDPLSRRISVSSSFHSPGSKTSAVDPRDNKSDLRGPRADVR